MSTSDRTTLTGSYTPPVAGPIPSPAELLARIRGRLQPILGERLKGLVLYGSVARGEVTDESDIDILALVDSPVSLWCDIQKIVRALCPLQIELLRSIQCFPVSVDDFEAGEFTLYRNAKRDGIFG